MEILCPILLVLVGLIVSQVDLLGDSEAQILDINSIGKQIILYGKGDNSINLDKYHFNNMENITCENINELTGLNDKELIKNFVEEFYNRAKDKEDSIDHEVDMTEKKLCWIFRLFFTVKRI